MKHAQNIDVATIAYQIRDAIVAVQQYSHPAQGGFLAVPDFGVINQHLGSIVYSAHDIGRGSRVIFGDVLENFLEPFLRLVRPVYFCHARIRRPISSFEMVRPASESARPR